MILINGSPESMGLSFFVGALRNIAVKFDSADAMLKICCSNDHALHPSGQPRVIRQHSLGHFAKAGKLVVEEQCFLLIVRFKEDPNILQELRSEHFHLTPELRLLTLAARAES